MHWKSNKFEEHWFKNIYESRDISARGNKILYFVGKLGV